ncbi:Na/Pi cotransporter family protein [Pelagibius marinus]|uniref:Na/Pi cotransporter family protein n=1 Tax=Pelagibius marinus TaxID=2762760 RepID=UPI001872B1D2|nr:Na/Pi symporter [Pelagibius marinus]
MGLALNAAGGLGIFLLAMAMMTEGLKVFGGERLRRSLQRWTSSPLRGVAAGAFITALVQSSSAVTVATIGFVNAGVLSLQHSLGVIFGANVGTTMTGWLVSLVGFNFKIEAFALPIIALGVALRVTLQEKRLRGLGEALTGFGLFFLGLSILKDSFSEVAATFGTTTLATTAVSGVGGIALFALFGLIATVLTQSSSAAIALIITAASQSVLGLGAAAAAVIGANVGTTSTAAFAVIGATPNAKRVAAGHILFNAGTGLIALAILPALLWGVEALGELLGLTRQPAIVLALFHTVFNLLGVALMLPFIGRLGRFLSRHFTTAEEDISRPRHLDRTVAATPAFAVPALEQELRRMQDLVCGTGLAAIAGQKDRARVIERRAEAIAQLGRAVAAFAVEVRMEGMSRTVAEYLARLLRVARYLDEAATLLSRTHSLSIESHRITDDATQASVLTLLASAQSCLMVCAETGYENDWRERLDEDQLDFEARYQETKAVVLRAAAVHLLSIEQADHLLDAMSSTRRMVEQLVKASLMLLDEIETRAQENGAAEQAPAEEELQQSGR